MSETRGRALILSNSYNNTREGSAQDYKNIKQMLDKFGFITAGGHKNYTAQVMDLHCYSVISYHAQLFICKPITIPN